MKHRKSTVLFSVFAMALMVYLFLRPAAVDDAVQNAIQLCGTVLIPSLFPFMVISAFLVSAETDDVLSPLPINHMFRLPPCTGSAIVLGALCGFPIGAKITCDLYKAGKIDKEEAQRLIPIANHPSPAFVIEIIGSYYWGSRTFGFFLLASEFLACMLTGYIDAQLSDKKTCSPTMVHPTLPKQSFFQKFTSAISSSSISTITVCGFIVFFSVLNASMGDALSMIRQDRWIPFLSAILEFTGGARYAAALGTSVGAFLTGFTVGWSGLSIIAQSSIFLEEQNLSVSSLIVRKCIHGILCGCFAFLYYRIRFQNGIAAETIPCFLPTRTVFSVLCTQAVIFGCILHAFHVRSHPRT